LPRTTNPSEDAPPASLGIVSNFHSEETAQTVLIKCNDGYKRGRARTTQVSYSHRMALEASLRLVEKHLERIRGELERNREPVRESILYTTRYDIGDSARSEMLKAEAEMLEEIGRMKTEFGLQVQEDTVKRHIRGSLTEIWVTIEELRPQALKGHGRLSEAAKSQIESHVVRLLRYYDDLSRALDG
jgi:hypothetical protein